MPKHAQKRRVHIALSGGVDSAVCALVLKEQGYDIRGIYMKTWAPEGRPCPWKEERRDAMRVCAHLGLPFEMWDFTREYKEKVVDYMIAEYAAGRTPNPDVMCNREIKFGLFFKRALAEGADYVATGHYARIHEIRDSRFEILRAKAREKDQSYFLWTLTQRHLSRALFPIGDFASKEKVRALARVRDLPVAEKPDSQGVCFIGPIDLGEFLREYIPASPGPIQTVSGRKIGIHSGLPFYTIGQREGIGVGGTGPYYVARKEAATNTLVVAPPAEERELMAGELVATDCNWIGEVPTAGETLDVQVRYRQTPVSATVEIRDSKFAIRFAEPVRAVTPGQSVAFYNDDVLLGGGIIAS